MPIYSYQAFTKQGKRTSGTVDAPTLQSAREQILGKQLYPVSIVQQTGGAAGGGFLSRLLRGRVSQKDILFFTKQMGVLLTAGVPVVGALDLLIEQSEGALRDIVIAIRDTVRGGQALADALAAYPYVFENIYVQLVRAGEASGKLEVVFKRLLEYLEKRAATRKRVASALRTPLIQLGIIVTVSSLLLLFVVPQLVQTFVSMGTELPLVTKLVLGVSNFVQNHFLVILGVIIGLFAAFKAWGKTHAGRRQLDSLKLKLPIMGHFTRMQTIVQFSRTLGTLIESGVNLPEALSIVSNIIDNTILIDTLERARENILKQGKMAEYLRQTGLFPSVAVYLINTGEQSGTLDQMLISVAEYYERELDDYSASLSSLINPLMLLVTGALVGTIILAIMLPMTNIKIDM